MKSGIYKIWNTEKNKVYIGSSFNVAQRFYFHRYYLNRGIHKNNILQNSWNKHGSYCFQFLVIEHCEPNKLIEREQFYIDLYKSFNKKLGYNIKPVAGSTLGYKHTEISLSKMKGGGFKGKKWSKEHREKFLLKTKGKPKSEEHKEKLRKAKTGSKVSEETKAKHRIITEGDGNPNRNKEKWPHENGKKCKCAECILKKRKMKNDYNRKWRNSVLWT